MKPKPILTFGLDHFDGAGHDSMGVGHGPAYGDPFVAFHSAANTALSLTMPGSFAGLENRKLARVPSSESKTQGMNWASTSATSSARRASTMVLARFGACRTMTRGCPPTFP
ncbi:MAG: hypothetical protein ACPG42_06100 [Alphaproteobacteria bacterium]